MIENPPNSFKEEMTSHLKQNAARLVLVLVITNLFTCQLFKFFLFSTYTLPIHVFYMYTLRQQTNSLVSAEGPKLTLMEKD